VLSCSDALNAIVDIDIENCTLWAGFTLCRIGIEIFSRRAADALSFTHERLFNRT
jgi:hypothetical protein